MAEEYPGKVGWGHSTVEYAASVCRQAGVKKLVLIHHDPSRNDEALDRIVERAREGLQRSGMSIEAAAEGQEFFVGNGSRLSASLSSNNPATVDLSSALHDPVLLMVAKHQGMVHTLLDAAQADGLRIVRAQDVDEVVRTAAQTAPSIVVLEKSMMDVAIACTRLKQLPQCSETPIIVLAEGERDADIHEGVVDWLAWPFSNAYARTRMRSWLLRTAPRWQRAALPPGEEQRLTDLYSLRLLDTAKEPRFDRLTRLAAGLLGAPIALVSLVDRDRQWFKSAYGLDLEETPRDTSFCAHAVASRDALVVPDTLADSRFAENPLVTGPQRFRFYAGHPLFVRDSCVGTLCVVDVRPRQLSPDRLELLRDLAALVEQELRDRAAPRQSSQGSAPSA
jgi:CheY-like chemotaxis protein